LLGHPSDGERSLAAGGEKPQAPLAPEAELNRPTHRSKQADLMDSVTKLRHELRREGRHIPRDHGGPAGGASGDTIKAFVEKLTSDKRLKKSITDVRKLDAREAEYGEWSERIHPGVKKSLEQQGVAAPYTHQSEAWRYIDDGRDVVVVTPTASGKSLCYSVPIASMLAESSDGCALAMFPTKALSRDQAAAFNKLHDGAGIDEIAYVYDGDTPADIRRRIRASGRLVLTNPDMLHTAILPHHDKWRRLFRSLKYIVVDEAHIYRGVFGSHVANVFRRLRRLAEYYGANPQFVFTSATIANPEEHAGRLAGRPVNSVTESGAPEGEKYVMLYNPPIRNKELKQRQSPNAAAHRLMRPLLEQGDSAIVFSRSRKGVEILTKRLREGFEDKGRPDIAQKIAGYRGGYLPDERRRIERGLRDGHIQAVISTNALELGVDIGSLDVCMIAGYPGTIASTWQQAGRAGRRQRTSLCIIFASDESVDQYIVRNPDFFFGASPEHARIDPDNLRILAEHLKCAVFEQPFRFEEDFGDLPREVVQEVLAWLADEAKLMVPADNAWHWSSDNYPATTVSIRDIPDENFVIIDTGPKRPKVLGEIDFVSAHKTVHEKAIYQHDGALFEVHRLDYPERKAYVRPVDTDYFTQAIDQTRVFVLDEFEQTEDRTPIEHGFGEVRVATRFVGYKKIRFRTWENVGYGEINLPDLERHTTSYWATFSSDLLSELAFDEATIQAAIQGIGEVMHTAAIIHLMCAKSDLLVTLGSRQGGAWVKEANRAVHDALALPVPVTESGLIEDPTVFLYDRYPGGVGFSEKLFDMRDELTSEALRLIKGCGCKRGCPACVGAPDELTEHGKRAAIQILEACG
jgi:DEAD/DEAH box helicase domain-containing protein